MRQTSRSIIIIPAPYHQPAHYVPLADALRTEAPVVVPDVTGLSLAEQTLRVQTLVDDCEESPVAVGHSFSGAVAGSVTGVAGIVFLDAFVLDEDETAFSLLATVDDAENAEFLGGLRPSEDGTLVSMNAGVGAGLFFNGCAPDAVRDGVALLTRARAENFSAISRAQTWKTTPNIFIRFRDDRAWAPSLVPRMMSRAERVVLVDGGHSSFFCDPGPAAQAIGDFVAGLSAETSWTEEGRGRRAGSRRR